MRKNAVRAGALENWTTAPRVSSVVGARWLFLLTLLFFFYTILTVRLLSALLARWKILALRAAETGSCNSTNNHNCKILLKEGKVRQNENQKYFF